MLGIKLLGGMRVRDITKATGKKPNTVSFFLFKHFVLYFDAMQQNKIKNKNLFNF